MYEAACINYFGTICMSILLSFLKETMGVIFTNAMKSILILLKNLSLGCMPHG